MKTKIYYKKVKVIEHGNSCKEIIIPLEYCIVSLKGVKKGMCYMHNIGNDLEIEIISKKLKCQKKSKEFK